MFEIFIELCLAGAPDACRDQLVPAGPFATSAACEAARSDLPAASFCAPAGEPIPFEEVAENVFVHVGQIGEPDRYNRGDVSNLGFVVGDASVAVIDAGGARWIGEGAWRAIRARTDLPIGHLILTHMHPDHVLGASVFAEAGAEIVAHADFDRALADRAANYAESLSRLIGPAFLGSEVVGTTVAVRDAIEISLGGRVLDMTAWPPAHTRTDVTVRDVRSGIVFAGDLVFDDHAPALDGSLLGWQGALRDLAAMPAAGVVPGHGGPLLPWPEGAASLRRYLDVLAADVRAAIAEGRRVGEVAETAASSEAAAWSLFEAYNPRNAIQAYTELEWE